MKRLGLFLMMLVMVLGCIAPAFADGPSTKGLSVTPLGEARIWTDRVDYKIGDPVRVSFKATIDGFAAIYDYPSDGTSKMIWPRNGQPALIKAGRTYSIPDGNWNITASEPAGTDTLVLVVSKARTNFTINLNLNWVFGGGNGGRKGLGTSDNSSSVVINPSPDSETMTAYWSFTVLPRWSKPVINIVGGAGARLFVDGQDYGMVTSSDISLEPGNHQLVAITPGMRVEYKDFNLKPNTTTSWWVKFKSVK